MHVGCLLFLSAAAQQVPSKCSLTPFSQLFRPRVRWTGIYFVKRVRLLTSVEMIPHREESHVEGHISHRWIGLEDRDDGNLDEHEEDGVLPGAGPGRQTCREISQGPVPLLETPDPPGPSSTAANCRDQEIPRSGKEEQTNTSDTVCRTLPINSHFLSTSSGPGPQKPNQESKLSQLSLLVA